MLAVNEPVIKPFAKPAKNHQLNIAYKNGLSKNAYLCTERVGIVVQKNENKTAKKC